MAYSATLCISNAKESVGSISRKIDEHITFLSREIKDYVNSKGGFINTQNLFGKYDNIWGFSYYCDSESVIEEMTVKAVAVKGNVLYVFMQKDRYAVGERELKRSLENEKDELGECWFPLTTWGNVLMTETILNIAECIEQY